MTLSTFVEDFYTVEKSMTKLYADHLRRALLRAAESLRGFDHRSGVRRSKFWAAFIRTQFNTGLRLGDMMSLTRGHIRESMLVVTQHKTGTPVHHRLQPETLAAIEATFPPDRDELFPWPRRREQFFWWFRKIVIAAGITRGSSKWLRRSGASYVEKNHPGAARAHLAIPRRTCGKPMSILALRFRRHHARRRSTVPSKARQHETESPRSLLLRSDTASWPASRIECGRGRRRRGG